LIGLPQGYCAAKRVIPALRAARGQINCAASTERVNRPSLHTGNSVGRARHRNRTSDSPPRWYSRSPSAYRSNSATGTSNQARTKPSTVQPTSAWRSAGDDVWVGRRSSSPTVESGAENVFMFQRWQAGLLFAALAMAGGCGTLPNDRSPTNNPYGASFSPDPTQTRWNRLLLGTRWIPEAPPPRP